MNDSGESFNKGKVTNVYINFKARSTVYEVMPENIDDKGELGRFLFHETELAYAPNTPVYYSSTGSFEKETDRLCGEVLYCRINPRRDLGKINDIRKELKNELQCLKSNSNDEACTKRIHTLLTKLDNEVSINRSILKETGIGRTVKSLSKVLDGVNGEASSATKLIEKWKSQIARPQFYYMVLISGDSHNLQILEDVPSARIKIKHS